MTTFSIQTPLYISIHAAQEGCDLGRRFCRNGQTISIHAAQEGCDQGFSGYLFFTDMNFNPRSPRGLRPQPAQQAQSVLQFQSTQPKRAATFICKIKTHPPKISIHAAQEGCDGAFVKIGILEDVISIHAAQEGCDVIYFRCYRWI